MLRRIDPPPQVIIRSAPSHHRFLFFSFSDCSELVISGSKPAARVTREPDSDIEADDPIFHNDRDTSATSSRSAPVILERPSSRGGAAFDISFEEENSGTENNTP